MVITERKNGYIINKSDCNKYIRKIGTDEVYEEAYDVVEYTYEETDELIPTYKELENE